MTVPSSSPLSGFPPIFQYSQDSLQDYSECARRFQLRHLIRQQWPAPLAEPLAEVERDLQLGEQFHRLLERHWLGLSVTPPPGELTEWWQAFVAHPPVDLPTAIRRPEATYSIPFGSRRLVAKFDLIAIDPGRQVVIVDWKTARHRPKRSSLAGRWQTRIYPYVAAEALSHEFGGALPPEKIRLVYWFTAAPQKPEVFQYDASQHAETRRLLEATIAAIEGRTEPIWPLTEDRRRCEACQFRSLCEREVPIATPEDVDPTEDSGVDEPSDWSVFASGSEIEL